MDHVLRYQDTPGIKMIVVLGEVKLKTYFHYCVCKLPTENDVFTGTANFHLRFQLVVMFLNAAFLLALHFLKVTTLMADKAKQEILRQ